jgi:hypothetical protein
MPLALYRKSTLGYCLDVTLKDLAEEGRLTDELAKEIRSEFDKVGVAAL